MGPQVRPVNGHVTRAPVAVRADRAGTVSGARTVRERRGLVLGKMQRAAAQNHRRDFQLLQFIRCVHSAWVWYILATAALLGHIFAIRRKR